MQPQIQVMRDNIPLPDDLMRPAGTEAAHATNEGVFPKFFYKPIQFYKDGQPDRVESVLHVALVIPGDQGSKPVFRLDKNPQLKVQYAAELEAFLARQDVKAKGTPLDTWGELTYEQCARLGHSFNVWTVEQLAGISDVNVQNMGPIATEWRAKAQLFVKNKVDPEALKAKIEALEAALRQRDAPANPGPQNPTATATEVRRGRPPKAA